MTKKKRGISDKERLDWLEFNPEFTMDWAYGEPLGIKMPRTFRKAIDRAMIAARRGENGK